MYYSVTHFQIHKNYELFVACIFKALLCILFTLKLELQFCTNFVKTFLLSPSLHLLLKLYWTALCWGQPTQICCCGGWWEISPFYLFLLFNLWISLLNFFLLQFSVIWQQCHFSLLQPTVLSCCPDCGSQYLSISQSLQFIVRIVRNSL